MALPSEAELARLFDDADLAREAYAAEVLVSWPSLRVLSVLCDAGEASTGELARAVNMDMGEVRDHLDALADLGVVADPDGAWAVTAEQVQLSVELDEELRVSHTVGRETAAEERKTKDEEPTGVFARFRRLVSRSR